MVPPPPRPGKGDNGVITKLPDIPFTMEKPVPEDLDKYIKNPGLPRANLSCDKEHPEGTYSPPRNLTVMQQHIAFWDRDHDGVIYPHDTFIGFRRLGFNLAICLASVPIIHGTFAWWSQDNWLPNPMFPILVKNIHRGKHGSDSEVYDTEGRFVPEKFEEIWSKYDKGNKGALTKHEIWTMIKGQRNIMDPVGWTAAWLEWFVSYLLVARQDKMMYKDDVRGILDGTIFYQIAQEREGGKVKPQDQWALRKEE
uniref:Caleosin n=1 Tax=Auxenochlorella protothecoides TaxID=3075 RepID=G1AUC6_AUXPR|nr:caleosin [Auxenochlorella protothecoides]